MIDSLASIETQIASIKEQRERYADRVFDSKNRIKKDASKFMLSRYYEYDRKLKKLQQWQYRLEADARKIQSEAKLDSLGLVVGQIYRYPRTGTVGILKLDDYGYMLLEPTKLEGITGEHAVALYAHSVVELRKENS